MDDFIPASELRPRGIYEIRARNFFAGAWNPGAHNGLGGFIGIREKFGDRYLFTEFLYDSDAGVLGTAQAVRLLGELSDERIRLWEHYPGTICQYCGRPCEYRKELRGEWDPETKEFTSWPWLHTEEVGDCPGDVQAAGRGTYWPLFRELEPYAEMVEDDFRRSQEDA